MAYLRMHRSRKDWGQDPRHLYPMPKPVADAKNPLGWSGTSSLFYRSFLPEQLPQAPWSLQPD